MVHRLSRSLGVVAALLVLFLLLGGGLLLRAVPAQAQTSSQNVMAVPACQCSSPTPVLGGGSGPVVVHCVCGALSCAVILPSGNQPAQHLQCAK